MSDGSGRSDRRRTGLGLAIPVAIAIWPATVGAPGTAQAAGHLALGIERLTFRDQRLSDTYGSRLGLTAAGDLLSRSRWDLTLCCSYLSGTNDPPHLAFIDDARTQMRMLPIRLQGRVRQRLGVALEAWAGPQVVWAWFRETWEADVPSAGVAARRSDSGSWFGLGGGAGLALGLGRAGRLRGAFEYVWCAAEREASPGNSEQADSMDGGWSAVSLSWEPPWLAF